MRAALIGWDFDDAFVDALARLGIDVVLFARGASDRAVSREVHPAWVKVWCPDSDDEVGREGPKTFGDSVLRRAEDAERGRGFDVVHALDVRSRNAACLLKERWPRSVAIAQIGDGDLAGDTDSAFSADVNCWICDHPWVLARWLALHAREEAPIEVILGSAGTVTPAEKARGFDGSLIAVWAPSCAQFDPDGVIAALDRVRWAVPRLAVVVLGSSPLAEALRRRIANRGWLPTGAATVDERTREAWDAWVVRSSVLGIASTCLPDDPAARLAWMRKVPVVPISAEPRALAEAIQDALCMPSHCEAEVAAGSALARREVEPSGVAAAWLRVYLAALARRRERRDPTEKRSIRLPLSQPRSRVSVIAVSPRAVDVAWSIRPEDWSTALEWLGPDAARAALVLRMSDVTDLAFHGRNARSVREVELSLAEQRRTIALDEAGRAIAASLGVRTTRGYFHPLAHARLCHLPREGLAPPGPARRLRVMPRRARS